MPSPRPSWQKKKKARHRRPRHEKRPSVRSTHGHDPRRLTLWLWSVNGETVTKMDAWGSADHAPSVCVHEGVRYDRVERQASTAKVVHYQTATVIHRTIPARQTA